MSVVIIVGGEKARQRVSELESASLSKTTEWRACAEQFLADFASNAKALCESDSALDFGS